MTLSRNALKTAVGLLDEAPKKWTHSICAGALVDGKGEVISDLLAGTACHSFLNDHYYKKAEYTEAIFTTVKRSKQKSREVHDSFVKWLARESLAAPFIVNPDLESIQNGGAIIDATEANSRLGLWICKALRYHSEDTYRPVFWYEMVQRGVSPWMAFLACSLYRDNILQNGRTHNSLFATPSKANLKKFLKTQHIQPPQGQYGSAGSAATSLIYPDGGYAARGDPDGIWPVGGSKKVKKPDGWGGYTEVEQGKMTLDDFAKAFIDMEKEYS